MKMWISALTAVGLAVFVASTLRAQQPAGGRTTEDGVFTEEQAKQGGTSYQQNCVMCHGGDLAGLEIAPALAGPVFSANWSGVTLDELFERIRVSMPADKPGTLSRQQIADVVAFILSVNKSPAGKSELPREAEALKAIKIVLK